MTSFRETLVAVASGSSGSAVGESEPTRLVHGIVLAVYLARTASPVSTTDVVIQEYGRTPALPVLAVNNVAADGWYYPRLTLHDAADGSEVVGPVDYVTVNAPLQLSISGANEGTEITATVEWEPVKP